MVKILQSYIYIYTSISKFPYGNILMKKVVAKFIFKNMLYPILVSLKYTQE